MDKNTARELYEKICDLIDGSTTAVLAPRLAIVKNEIDQIFDDLTPSNDDNTILSAPTAWHAAIVLVAIMSELANKTPLDEQFAHVTSMKDLDFVPAMNVLFRGQSDVDKVPIPTLYRKGVDRDHARRCQASFCLYLRHAFETLTGFSFQSWIYQSAAQHYELKTSLLDWTTDPTVATYFAATGKVRNPGQMAGVFVMLLASAVGNGAKFFLPPPFVERLYLQRGVFTHVPEDTPELFGGKTYLQIRFPAEPDFYIRRNQLHVDIYPDSQWLDSVKVWAQMLVDSGEDLEMSSEPTPTEIAALTVKLDQALVDVPIPSQITANCESLVEHWLEHVLSMIGYLSQLETSQGLKMNTQSLTAIVHDNARIMKAVAEYLKKQAELQPVNIERPNYFDQLAELIEKALESCPDA